MSYRHFISAWILSAFVFVVAATPATGDDKSLMEFADGVCTLTGDSGNMEWQPDHRLQLCLEGSIEFWLMLPASTDLKAAPIPPTCLLSCNDTKTGSCLYGVYFDQRGYYVSKDGAPPTADAGPFPYQEQFGATSANPVVPGVWQHVVITIANDPNGSTTSGQNNNRAKQTFCSFQLPGTTGRAQTITVGVAPKGSKAGNFTGSIGAVRLWDRQLNTAEIQWLESSPARFDVPGVDCPAVGCLLAHCSGKSGLLTDPTFVAPRIVFGSFDVSFSTEGTTEFSRRPCGKEVKTLWAKFKTDAKNKNGFPVEVPAYLDKLLVEYDTPGAWSLQPAVDGNTYRSSRDVPVILPVTGVSPTYASGVWTRDFNLGRDTPEAAREIAFRASVYKQQALGFDVGRSLGVTQLKGLTALSMTGSSTPTAQQQQSLAALAISDSFRVGEKFALFRPTWTGDGRNDQLDTSKPIDRIIGATVGHDGAFVTSIRFVTASGALSGICECTPDGPLPADRRRATTKFVELKLPTTYPEDFDATGELSGKPAIAIFEGFVTRRSEHGLHAVALAYSFASNPKPNKRKSDAMIAAQGVWIMKNGDWKNPTLDVVLAKPTKRPPTLGAAAAQKPAKKQTAYHGNYTSSPVYAIKFDGDRNLLTLHRDSFQGLGALSLSSLVFSREPVRKRRTSIGKSDAEPAKDKYTGRWISPAGDILTIDGGAQAVTVAMANQSSPDKPRQYTLTRPTTLIPGTLPTSSDGTSKGSAKGSGSAPQSGGWGVMFMGSEQQVRMDTMYHGYDPSKLSPGNYLTTVGRDIFKQLKTGSLDYYLSSSNNKYLPNGLYFDLRPIAKTSDKTWVAKSSSEDQSSWGFDLGQNIGIPGIGSFSDSLSYKTEQSKTITGESLTIRSRCIILDHALIVNRSAMQLNDGNDEIAAQIMLLMERSALNIPNDWNSFFDNFGSHYAYAVTYGGIACATSQMNEQGYATMEGSSLDVKASAEIDAGGVFKAGSNAGYQQSRQDTFNSSRGTTKAETAAYGGSLSKDGGFSCSADQVVPVFLDLRPLYELLSPVYFDDPYVWNQLRMEMQIATDAYMAAKAKDAPWVKSGPVAWASNYPGLIPKKREKAFFLNSNSQFSLINKDMTQFLGKQQGGESASASVSYGAPIIDGGNSDPTIGSDGNYTENSDGTWSFSSSAEVMQFDGTDAKPMLSNMPFSIVLVNPATADKTLNKLTVDSTSVSWCNFGSDDTRTRYTIEVVGDPPGKIRPIPYGAQIRIKNVSYQQYLSIYSHKSLWSTASNSGDESIWVIGPPGIDNSRHATNPWPSDEVDDDTFAVPSGFPPVPFIAP